MGVGAEVGALAVDEAVRQEEDRHPQFPGGAVLPDVVTHHQAVLRPDTHLLQQLLVIDRVGLGIGAVLHDGDVAEVLRLQARPADPGTGGRAGEDGVGGQKGGDAPAVEEVHHGFGHGVAAADGPGQVKFVLR